MTASRPASCEFDSLFAKNVPHILEGIFFSLDLDSYKTCREVSKTWRELFSTARFCKKAKELALEMKRSKKKLLDAAEEGNADEVKRLLLIGVHPNGDDYTTPLCVAAKMDKKGVVEMLLDRGAEPDMADKDGCTPICWAAREDHMDMVTLLFNRGANPNKGKIPEAKLAYEQPKYMSLLTWIVGRVDHPLSVRLSVWNNQIIDFVKKLLNDGADPNLRYGSGKAALHGAVRFKNMGLVKLLLNRGADPNIKDEYGEPLLNSLIKKEEVMKHNIDIVKQLLDAGADINMTDKEGKTALWFAVYKEYKDTVKLLLNLGGDPNKGTIRGDTLLNTVLHWEPSHGNYVAGLMLDNGADPNKADCWGTTPLIVAVGRMNEVVKKLLDKGADPNKAVLYGITPLYKAAKCGHTDLVQLLLDRGADPNQAIRNGNTPLHCAAKFGHEDCVKLLLERGAEPHKGNTSGETPLHAAEREGHKGVVQLILHH